MIQTFQLMSPNVVGGRLLRTILQQWDQLKLFVIIYILKKYSKLLNITTLTDDVHLTKACNQSTNYF